METLIAPEQIADGPTQRMTEVINTCVHCGFCLATCPTYLETGSELDSPRGRIYLMKGVLDSSLELDSTVVHHVDRCLGCLACVTACPSGVQYNELIDNFRPKLEAEYARAPIDKGSRRLLMEVLPYPRRFRWAVRLGKLSAPLAPTLPRPLRSMLSLLPDALPPPASIPEVTPAQGARRARVALLTGCVQSVLDPEISLATIRVLARNGVEVIIPKDQGCCGALAGHIGQKDSAQRFARQALDAFPTDVDAVLTNAAGCGSQFKEYAHLLAGTADAERAQAFAARAQDVSQFLAGLGLSAPIPPLKEPLRIAYHDACHLGHGQGVRTQPRALLSSIPGVQVVELPESEICCGSAGVYNITQPDMAADLLARKVANIRSTATALVATGNIGCMTQLRNGLAGSGIRVAHTLQVLDWAYTHELGTRR